MILILEISAGIFVGLWAVWASCWYLEWRKHAADRAIKKMFKLADRAVKRKNGDYSGEPFFANPRAAAFLLLIFVGLPVILIVLSFF